MEAYYCLHVLLKNFNLYDNVQQIIMKLYKTK